MLRSWTLTKVGTLCLLVVSLALTSCATGRRSDIAYAPTSFDVPPDPVLPVTRDHRLAPSDLVTVTVYRAPEVTGDYRVDHLGNLSMPLIGQIPVLGLTTDELTLQLRERLSGQYYVDPDVVVALKETPQRTITVDGSVGAPGVYPIAGRTTLMQAVALARGTTGSANLRRVVVFRQIEGQRMAAGFDLRAIRLSQMEDPVVYPSDIIIVDGSETRQMWRDVLSTVPVLALFRPFLY